MAVAKGKLLLVLLLCTEDDGEDDESEDDDDDYCLSPFLLCVAVVMMSALTPKPLNPKP